MRIGSRSGALARAACAVLVCGALALTSAPAPSAASAPRVAVKSDLVYVVRSGGELRLDAYRPTGRTALPVLILVHGGSWRRGDKSELASEAKAFARAGFLVLAVNYRLAPPGGATTFPGPVRDLRAALRWARRNAARFEGDPRRIGMVGGSAGAHLTVLVASTGRVRPGAVALYSPPVDLAAMHEQGVASDAIEALLACSPTDCPDRYTRASGLFQVDPLTAPVFLVYSADEVLPVGQGRRLNERLSELGIRHRTYELDGSAHGFAAGGQVFDPAIRFLKRSL